MGTERMTHTKNTNQQIRHIAEEKLRALPNKLFFLNISFFFLAGIGLKTGNKLAIYASFARISSTYARSLFHL